MAMPQKIHEKFNGSYRFALKAEIHRAGYRRQGDFCNASGLSEGVLARIINGMDPSPDALRKLAKGLSLTVAETLELL